MKNRDVVQAFYNGKVAHTEHLFTNGTELYSYRLLIAYKKDGQVWVITYRNEFSVSKTTARHVGLLFRIRNNFRKPTEAELEYARGLV